MEGRIGRRQYPHDVSGLQSQAPEYPKSPQDPRQVARSNQQIHQVHGSDAKEQAEEVAGSPI